MKNKNQKPLTQSINDSGKWVQYAIYSYVKRPKQRNRTTNNRPKIKLFLILITLLLAV